MGNFSNEIIWRIGNRSCHVAPRAPKHRIVSPSLERYTPTSREPLSILCQGKQSPCRRRETVATALSPVVLLHGVGTGILPKPLHQLTSPSRYSDELVILNSVHPKRKLIALVRREVPIWILLRQIAQSGLGCFPKCRAGIPRFGEPQPYLVIYDATPFVVLHIIIEHLPRWPLQNSVLQSGHVRHTQPGRQHDQQPDCFSLSLYRP